MAQTRTVDEWLRSRSSNKFGTEHIRNDSILSVGQSKKNTNTDTRIENSHDEDRGIIITRFFIIITGFFIIITGFFKSGNQYTELHEEHIRNDSILTHVGQLFFDSIYMYIYIYCLFLLSSLHNSCSVLGPFTLMVSPLYCLLHSF